MISKTQNLHSMELQSSGDKKIEIRVTEKFHTSPDSSGAGLLQALFLDNEAGANEQAGRDSKDQTLDVIRGHGLIGVRPAGRLSRHEMGENENENGRGNKS